MPDRKEYTEKTEVKTETKRGSRPAEESEYSEETTVKTERTVEKDQDEVIIIENK